MPIVSKIADEAFDVEREKAKEADALAQVFQISSDLTKSRLLIQQVITTAFHKYARHRFHQYQAGPAVQRRVTF